MAVLSTYHDHNEKITIKKKITEYSQNNWQGGYGQFIGVFEEMAYTCFMGTQISFSVSMANKLGFFCIRIFSISNFDTVKCSQQILKNFSNPCSRGNPLVKDSLR